MKNFRSRAHRVEKLLAAPLEAAVHANGQMQKQQADYLMDVAFVKNGDTFSPVIIEMELINYVNLKSDDTSSPEFKEVRSKFSLPLLTILPLSSLAVDHLNVNFDMELTEQHSSSDDDSAILKGKVSHDSKEIRKTNNTNSQRSVLKVHMEANTLPLPVGVTTLIDLYQKSIQPKKPQ